MALLGVGADLTGFKDLFERRTADLERECIAPLDELSAEVQDAQRRLAELRDRLEQRRAQAWTGYKRPYERYLQPSTKETP
jgi:hypothetical protein